MAASTSGSAFADEDEGMLSDINVTPLVDVVLVLLIVFMITVPAIVASAPIKVNLPESTSVAGESPEVPLMISLKIESSGELAVYLNEAKTTEGELPAALKALGVVSDEQRVTLAADKTIPYGSVVNIMDVLHSTGLRKIALVTKRVSGATNP